MSRKKIHRFLLSSPVPIGDVVTITDERVVHQVGRVLKMKPGEVIAVFSDGSDDTVGQIESIDTSSIVLEKINELAAIKSTRELIAAVAIPKGDTFELIVQKLTELGVSTIIPLITERTVKQSVRIERLQTISDEALEQCGGSARTLVHEPMDLRACMESYPYPSVGFEPGSPEQVSLPSAETLVMYIGPEGGWSDTDLTELKGITWMGLGERILRTETAAIVAAYLLR